MGKSSGEVENDFTSLPGNHIFHRDYGVIVRIIAGEFEGVKGAINEIYAEPEYLDVYIPTGSSFEQPVKQGYNSFAYVFEGEGVFGDFELESWEKGTITPSIQLIRFGDGDLIMVYAEKDVRFLLVSGKPLKEPIARYGAVRDEHI